MRSTRVENMDKFKEEIFARPKKTWIQNSKEKQSLQEESKKRLEGGIEANMKSTQVRKDVKKKGAQVQKLTKEDGSLLSKANMEYVGSNPSAKIQGGAFVPLDCWKCLILLLFCTEATFYFRGGLDFYWDSFLQAVVDLPLIVLLQS